ncbi:MAG: LytR/AlgR family response regulator transcription factor [Flammeovirgaceae bacterium]
MTVKCLIVDDEPLAINVIKNYVQKIDGFEVVQTFENPIDAFNLIGKQSIDLLFLDINMPVLNGLDLLKSLETPPLVVFTTAYREYAVESFELDVVDYLVKPIPFPRFMKAINKVVRLLKSAQEHTDEQSGEHKFLKNTDEPYIFLKVEKKLVKVYLHEILYIESLKDYVKVKTIYEELIVHQSLTGLTEQLPSDQFIRIHRSYTIAIQHVKSLEGNMLEIKTKLLPIGRNYQHEVKETILSSGVWKP